MKILLAITFFILQRISENSDVFGVKQDSQRGIIFPNIDQYDKCFIDEPKKILGKCKKLSECTKALERWNQQNIRPQTCYFNKFEHIVCCENEPFENKTSSQTLDTTPVPEMKIQRRKEPACDLFRNLIRPVVHGVVTKPQEFPYMAALGWKSNFGNRIIYNCGGALISSKFVLTAAHCVDMGGEAPYSVRLGGVNLTDSSVEDVLIKRIIIHPDYKISSSYNDIALLELTEDVRFSLANYTACVWSEEEVKQNNVTAIGYGHTRFGNCINTPSLDYDTGISSNKLLKANLVLIPNNICKRYFPPDYDFLSVGLADSQICAGDPEKLRDTCQGDSGGPITSYVQHFGMNFAYVVGITSLGQGCAGGAPSIYTRTSSFINWIEDIVWPLKLNFN